MGQAVVKPFLRYIGASVQQTDTKPELVASSDPERQREREDATSPSVQDSSGVASSSAGITLLTVVSTLAYLVYLPLRITIRYLIRHPLHAIVVSALIFLVGVLIATGAQIHSQVILSRISNETVDKIIEKSRFSRSYDADAVDTRGDRELLRVGAPNWMQRESVRAILFYARKAELSLEDQAALLAIADIESGFNPMARASTTSACGLFQFVKETGNMFSLSRSDCMDPWANAKAGIEHYQANYRKRIVQELEGISGAERAFRTFELSYYLHHDGPASATHSDEVKALILTGSPFLFHNYRTLLKEAESQQHAPSFAESFYHTVLQTVNSLKERIEPTSAFAGGRDDADKTTGMGSELVG